VPNCLLSRPARTALLTAGVLALCAAGAVLPGCRDHPRTVGGDPFQRIRTSPDDVAAQFVGDQACVGCHPSQFKDHRGSNHARTLGPMSREFLAAGFPKSGGFVDAETGVRYMMEEKYGQFWMSARDRAGEQSRKVDLVLGSGKRAMTFISLDSPSAIRELRMSYLFDQRKWFVTPGQQGHGMDAVGVQWPHDIAQRCLGCHSTVLPESRMVPEERFMGIGCETCHGPGKAHVAAAQAGPSPGKIQKLRAWGATRLNELCGECHRSTQDVDPHNDQMTAQTQRFQPFGLMKSECFKKSGDKLSCVTCHDPHRNVETSHAVYERTCRSCHGDAPKSTVCPVNPRGGCVSCHMPQRELWNGIAISMSDHWIRVFPESRNKPAPAAGGKERASTD
jgi:hypothetical protein